MLKKKQVLTIVSIAVVSFLFGTMFNFTTTVTGDSGSPWDRVWTSISELESKMETLEEQLLPQGFITAPAWDSGWLPASTSWITLEHGLGTTDAFVYIVQNCTDHGISHNLQNTFLWLRLTDNEITVSAPPHWGHNTAFRVMIWKISEPST